MHQCFASRITIDFHNFCKSLLHPSYNTYYGQHDQKIQSHVCGDKHSNVCGDKYPPGRDEHKHMCVEMNTNQIKLLRMYSNPKES